MEKTKKPAALVVLRENCIIGGQFFAAGEALPFEREEDLPAALKPLVATGTEEVPPFDPAERNIYDLPRHLRRQVRGIQSAWDFQHLAEEQAVADQKLPAETQEVLETAHAAHIAKLKAQAEYNAKLSDAIYENAVQEAEGRTVQFFVKRGGEMACTERAKLKPGEKCFMREGDEWVFVGFIDSTGEPPPQPIIT